LAKWYGIKVNFRFTRQASVQLQNWCLKFAFPSIWRMSIKYSTQQHTVEQLSGKQMSKIWCKNIYAFLRFTLYFRRHGPSPTCNVQKNNKATTDSRIESP